MISFSLLTFSLVNQLCLLWQKHDVARTAKQSVLTPEGPNGLPYKVHASPPLFYIIISFALVWSAFRKGGAACDPTLQLEEA